MEKNEVFEVLETKGKELSDWLKKNFDPYVAIVITDSTVKIVRDEMGIPNLSDEQE